MPEETERERAMRDRLWEGLRERIPDIALNGHPEKRLPNTLNFRVEGIEGEAMILCLDMNLVSVSSGSACTTGSLDPSHVLLAMGIPAEMAHGSQRVSLGRGNDRAGHRLLSRHLPAHRGAPAGDVAGLQQVTGRQGRYACTRRR